MRKCLRCNVEMVEDLDVKIEGGAYGLKVTQQGIFQDNLGKFRCAVCPECGYIETYIQDTSKIKKLTSNKKKKNLILVSGDIIENSNKYNVEAIVNTANKYMNYGCGVCGAIYKKVGIDKLETYCHSKWINDMEVNEIRITTGFSLCKDIIHIYCPRYYEEQEPLEKLKESYQNLFNVILKEKYTSVIVPSLATGFHGYKHQDVAQMVMELLIEFCSNNDVKIIFDLFNEDDKQIYEKYI